MFTALQSIFINYFSNPDPLASPRLKEVAAHIAAEWVIYRRAGKTCPKAFWEQDLLRYFESLTDHENRGWLCGTPLYIAPEAIRKSARLQRANR